MLLLSIAIPETLRMIYYIWVLIGLPINRFCTYIFYGIVAGICFFIAPTLTSLIAYIPPVFVYKSCESNQQTEHLTNIESSINNSKVVLKKTKAFFLFHQRQYSIGLVLLMLHLKFFYWLDAVSGWVILMRISSIKPWKLIN
jgi:hypothetical protein